jgi:hypothetical protein
MEINRDAPLSQTKRIKTRPGSNRNGIGWKGKDINSATISSLLLLHFFLFFFLKLCGEKRRNISSNQRSHLLR